MSWSIHIQIFIKIRNKKFFESKNTKNTFKVFKIHPKKNIYFPKVVDDEKLME